MQLSRSGTLNLVIAWVLDSIPGIINVVNELNIIYHGLSALTAISALELLVVFYPEYKLNQLTLGIYNVCVCRAIFNIIKMYGLYKRALLIYFYPQHFCAQCFFNKSYLDYTMQMNHIKQLTKLSDHLNYPYKLVTTNLIKYPRC